MILIKLGGSVITKKSKKHHFNHRIMDQLATEIKNANTPLILIHGAGSFGHITAQDYALNDGFKNPSQLHGFVITHAAVQQLNTYVLASLHQHHIPAVSLPPHAILHLDNHQLDDINYSLFQHYLDKGFTPVTFGDVVLDKTLGFSICSGDLLIKKIAEHFKPEKAIFVLDEDGLYTSNPKIDPHATFIPQATTHDLNSLTTTADTHADVTQGMQGKIETIKHIAALDIPTYLINGKIQNRLLNTLTGKKTTHTIIIGEKK